ncbi:uncharacterized protein DUF4326 [Pseudonocardia sediminis]|uniref:Uncharacterized protein DUF4326 n=1 Tax=Pseudonocardia sediminis TaxID=1397368 RepID=A0A4Q7URI8_PSEST|nr:DUF4326 domain-containing protein [Pseudonocardia sediminis]RZT83311.1 uncharacterized protein DUF4326 [Pseudonocardia sediminis]
MVDDDSARPAGPQRIRLRRKKGWRKPDGAVLVTRPGPWGNPFDVREMGREPAITEHRRWLFEQPDLVERVRDELAGHDLCCWCDPDQLCHADTLIEVANSRPGSLPEERAGEKA